MNINTSKERIFNVLRLSIPAILTQISSIIMQYIDAAMVGDLGANASASVGLVSTTTWLFGGICTAISVGFSVQVAHSIGASDTKRARDVLKHGIITAFLLSLLLAIIGILISEPLPVFLRADSAIHDDATLYFLVYSITIPFMQMNYLASACLQCSGNMVTPSILNTVCCLLDVIFNAIFIPKYGVMGAAIGTSLSVVTVSLVMMYFCFVKSPALSLPHSDKSAFDKDLLKKAFKIGFPVAVEEGAMCSAMIATTAIIAPLGNVAVAATSFAITAESICYMPGYGLGYAATALVGQSMGASDKKLAKTYGNIAISIGAVLLGILAFAMYFVCPFIFKMMTPDQSVRNLAAEVLRICLICEPLFGVSIVASGALRGAEDTLVPSILNMSSLWIVRVGLALLLVKPYGLYGVWVAMTIELCVRGILMLIRQFTSKHYK